MCFRNREKDHPQCRTCDSIGIPPAELTIKESSGAQPPPKVATKQPVKKAEKAPERVPQDAEPVTINIIKPTLQEKYRDNLPCFLNPIDEIPPQLEIEPIRKSRDRALSMLKDAEHKTAKLRMQLKAHKAALDLAISVITGEKTNESIVASIKKLMAV
jgi:hypothetical protein